MILMVIKWSTEILHKNNAVLINFPAWDVFETFAKVLLACDLQVLLYLTLHNGLCKTAVAQVLQRSDEVLGQFVWEKVWS